MQHQKIFSLPINPKLDSEVINSVYIPFLKEHSDLIYDLYFTSRIAPFHQDAMGEVFIGGEDADVNVIKQALYISQETGIPLSATFNNIHVPPTQQNLDIFIENFKYLYAVGIKMATLPHTSWVMTGQIQKEFPDLFIKNTILREVTKPNEIVSLAKAGFHYINLDRDLMRDRDTLLKIKEAKEYCASIGKPVKISLLTNESCWGGCPIMPEHYHFNNTREPGTPQYFNDGISRVSCSTWDLEDSATALKAANLPPWKKDWEEFIDLGIDVFKMHGRESAFKLQNSMDAIHRWKLDEEYIFPEFKKYSDDVHLAEKPIDVWREKIKNCKFDCWNCHYCEVVIENSFKKEDINYLDSYVERCLNSINKSYLKESNYKKQKIQGLSSDLVKHLLNNLCNDENTVYLETGVYMGSTFFAATDSNNIPAFAVDNFSENVKPIMKHVPWREYPSPEDELEFNWSHLAKETDVFIKKSVTDVTEEDLNGLKPNVVFYDSDHSFEGQLKSLNSITPLLADKFILVIDDANFMEVIESANEYVRSNEFKVLYDRKILSKIPEDANDFWNGIQIFVLEKP